MESGSGRIKVMVTNMQHARFIRNSTWRMSLILSLCGWFVLRFRRKSKLKSEAAYNFTPVVRPVGWGGVGEWGLVWWVGLDVQWGKFDGYMSYVSIMN